MPLITSISGIRGTIGGTPGSNLTPDDIVKFTSAFGSWILESSNEPKVVLGRDARPSGEMVKDLVISTLLAMGIHVEDLDFATTPTVEMAVIGSGASGGIIITASHNPENWNALKLLNSKGEFLSPGEADKLFEIANSGNSNYATVGSLGEKLQSEDWLNYHIDKILSLSLVDSDIIRKASFKVAVDVINSVGALSIPSLFNKLGVSEFVIINEQMNGKFEHNPEPLPEHLSKLSMKVVEGGFHLGVAVDPDVDRLCFICEDGSFFGEEYTLVSITDYWLSRFPGNTVSNLSSSRALADVTERYNGKYYAAAVGEINVVEEMKERKAVIGGEGNGGVIIPELHYGRDALAGIALFLTCLAESGQKASELRSKFPSYFMSKKKIQLDNSINVDEILNAFHRLHENEKVTTIDGVKVDFEDSWIHLRKSNTEPIIRIYTEAKTADQSEELALETINQIRKITNVKA